MASRFAFRLATNYCPSDEEVQEIQAFLVEPALQLKRLNDEIEKLQLAIDKLAKERDTVKVHLEGYRALLSPARRLPLDILQEIFIACMPKDRNCVMSASEAPLLLGRICSAWRNTAQNTPRLWSKLHVVEPAPLVRGASTKKRDAKLVQRLETMKMWLERSGHCPLSISFDSGYNEFPVLPPSAPSTSRTPLFVKALIPFATRWQHIQLTTTQPALESLQELTEDDVPMLQSVKFYQHRYDPPYTLDWTHCSILRGPRLSGFFVWGPGPNFRPSELPLQWNQLTALSLGGDPWTVPFTITSSTMLHIIAQCPELRTCKLVLTDDPSTAAAGSPAAELAFLHTLEIHFGGAAALAFSDLLDHLTMPRLEHLSLYGHRLVGPHPAQPEPLDPPFFARFFATLESLATLHVSSDAFSKPALAALFRALPSTLRNLRIFDTSSLRTENGVTTPMSPLDDSVLEVLVPAPGDTVPSCPALRSLVIDHCFHISDAALIRLVAGRMARNGGVQQLQHLQIQFEREAEQAVLPALQPLIETGLVVKITYPPLPTFSPWDGLQIEEMEHGLAGTALGVW